MKNSNNEVKTSVFERFRKYINRSFHDKRVGNGLYVSIVSVLFIAVVIFINMIVTKADITADLTADKQYSITKDTVKFLKDVKDDIVIYYFAEPDKVDESVYKLVKEYENNSKHVKVIKKDPVQYPTLLAKFTETTEQTSVDNSVVVVMKDDESKFKYLPYASLMLTEIDYQTYQTVATGVDAEGQITSAINSLVSDISKKFYMVTGHNEAESFASDIQDLFSKQNFTTESLTLLTSKSVPDDCDMLIMLSPQSDYLEEEVKIIEDYLDKGNPVLFLTGYINDSLPNLGKLLNKYGLKNNEKLVIDKDKSRTAATGSTIMYPIVEEHDITDDFDNAYVAMDVATGFTKLEEVPEGVTVTTLLKTSDRGYLVNDVSSLGSVNSTNSKKGEYILGAVATKDVGEDKKGTLIAYSASSTFDINTQIETAMYMNADLIMNSIYYACDIDGAATISIPAKPIQDIRITMEGADVILCVMLTIIVVPVIILVMGFVVWMRRRRK